MKRSTGNVILSVDADEVFLPLVTTYVENAALCFGLGKNDALNLTLAVEEVFLHLCRVVMPTGGPLEILCSNGGYYARASFHLPTGSFDMRAFNLTATISMEDDADLETMGLVIASRSVDRFLLSREEGRSMRLTLIKEKTYPIPSIVPVAVNPIPEWSLRPPVPEEVKFISRLSLTYYDTVELSNILHHPGKLADMIRAGEYKSLAAVGRAGEIGGAIFWHQVGEHMMECIGPYVFNQGAESDIPHELMEACIGSVAKTKAVGIMNTRLTSDFSRFHFEFLGEYSTCSRDGSCMPVEAWFRLLREDAGATVWVHPGIEAFLRGEYSRLVLPREIRIAQPLGETLPGHSVLSAEFNRIQGRVTLSAIWPGEDAEENIERHVRLLEGENILNIHFLIDLGEACQSIFVPGLLRNGFEPCLVFPYAGKGDKVLFQHRGNKA